MTKTNQMTVTGRILNLEEKKSNGGSFYLVDLETFYGPNIRFQAWNEAYEFIKRNQLRSANSAGIGGDYLDVIGYTHTYMLENRNGVKNQYVTFKTRNIKRPTARVTYSGKIHDVGCKDITTLTDEIGFLFDPDTPCFDNGQWMPANSIQCVINTSKLDYAKLLDISFTDKVKAVISGEVDNTDKKLTKVVVDSITLEEEDVDADK